MDVRLDGAYRRMDSVDAFDKDSIPNRVLEALRYFERGLPERGLSGEWGRLSGEGGLSEEKPPYDWGKVRSVCSRSDFKCFLFGLDACSEWDEG